MLAKLIMIYRYQKHFKFNSCTYLSAFLLTAQNIHFLFQKNA
jgi:hypothetical protein